MSLLSPLYNLPNHVLEKQKAFQNSSKPLVLRGPRAGIYVGGYAALFTVGMLSTVYACGNLIAGKKT
ncbi:hypothetical protein CPC08DRAFT_703325, partial [Agrocybe pediades]